jgi:KDO2-lipid IV(A) lauroyltransferase
LRWRYALFGVVFFIGYRVFGLRRRVIRSNLARSFPQADRAELRKLERDFVARQAEIFAEIDYALQPAPDELRRRVRLIDPAQVLSGDTTQLLVIVAGHQCNFEWAQLRLSLELGAGIVSVYKPMRGRAEQYFHSRRTRFGGRVVPAKAVTREIAMVRSARALGMVADQVPRTSPERHWTEFLNQPTAFFKGPERLCRALRGRMVYLSTRRLGRGRYEIELQPLMAADERLPSGEATERYVRALERDIHADPAGWWWSHKRWKLAPPE